MLEAAGSGHPASALGLADLFVALYFGDILSYRADQPAWPDRDYFLMSNGHACPVWYATLAEAGFFAPSELSTLRHFQSRLQGHPQLGSLAGIENSSGPLGQGLSQAVGLALGLRLRQASNHVFCLLSDAEHQSGQTWEAYQAAAHFQLAHLTVIIDRNFIQIDGATEKTMALEPLAEKLRAFNWHVKEVDGHDLAQLIEVGRALKSARLETTQPSALICKTVPGKGVDFMEGEASWHGKVPTAEELVAALTQLQP